SVGPRAGEVSQVEGWQRFASSIFQTPRSAGGDPTLQNAIASESRFHGCAITKEDVERSTEFGGKFALHNNHLCDSMLARIVDDPSQVLGVSYSLPVFENFYHF